MDPLEPTAASEEAPGGTSRRTLLRAGMHAVWVIPAVQVISSVPAFAASGAAAIKTNASGSWTGNGTSTNVSGIAYSLTLENTNTSTPSGAVVVTIASPTWTSGGAKFSTKKKATTSLGSITASDTSLTLTIPADSFANGGKVTVNVTCEVVGPITKPSGASSVVAGSTPGGTFNGAGVSVS